MASRASVTVSIAADTKGILSRMPRVNCVTTETSLGKTLECAAREERRQK
jgi:hypothetical protein